MTNDAVAEPERQLPHQSGAVDAFPDNADTDRAIAERRLAQIIETLGLLPDHFERAHEAEKQALDGGHDRILSDQERRLAEAFPEISDALVRARVVELMEGLADDDDLEPSAG